MTSKIERIHALAKARGIAFHYSQNLSRSVILLNPTRVVIYNKTAIRKTCPKFDFTFAGTVAVSKDINPVVIHLMESVLEINRVIPPRKAYWTVTEVKKKYVQFNDLYFDSKLVLESAACLGGGRFQIYTATIQYNKTEFPFLILRNVYGIVGVLSYKLKMSRHKANSLSYRIE